jgi:hypothetical protein
MSNNRTIQGIISVKIIGINNKGNIEINQHFIAGFFTLKIKSKSTLLF